MTDDTCQNRLDSHVEVYNVVNFILFDFMLCRFCSFIQSASFEFKFPHYEKPIDVEKSFVFKNKEHSSSTEATEATEEFSQFLVTFAAKIMGLSLKQKDTNTIFETSIELLKNVTIFNKKWLSDANLQACPNDFMDFTFDIAYQHFLSYRSTYGQKKNLRRKEGFVEPVERAIGTRWEQKKMKLNGRTIHIPRLIQSTLTYIPILETLKSIFKCEEFAALYFKYNQSMMYLHSDVLTFCRTPGPS